MTTVNNETEMQDYLHRNLKGSAREQAKKLSTKDLLVLQHQVKQLYNATCMSCKNKMMCNPSSFKNISDLCESCQQKESVIKIFKTLEKLNKRS